MSPNDIQWWSLVVGLTVFAVVVAAAFIFRRLRERRHGPTEARGEFVVNRETVASATPTPEAGLTPRRKPTPPPPAGELGELASAIRSAILRAVAERAPAGWSALVLAPPLHPGRMTWHVHLAPEVALDVRDGRTVTVAPPRPTHDWQIAGGRVMSLGEGDPDPAPGDEAVTIRVTGPYLTVTVGDEGPDGVPALVTRVVVTSEEELPRARATATDLRAVQGALREAIELTVGSRMTGPSPTAGYARASWSAHERIWLTISR